MAAACLWLQAERAPQFEAPVRLKAGDACIDTGQDIAHSGPQLFDLDGDQLPDLVVGNFRGTFQIYKNVGTSTAPAFASKGFLQADGKQVKVPNW
ncbi:MAG: hypothetical protein U1E76_12900 [Planctomycetota bacterium]